MSRLLIPHLGRSHAALEIHRRTRVRHLMRHAFEMAVLGVAFRQLHVLAFGAGFDELWHDRTELAVFGMIVNMTLPMVAWMRHR